jgi:hypothetical protein
MTNVSLSRPSAGLATVRTRCRILALALPVTAMLLLIGGALTPRGLDRPVTSLSGALRELQIAAAHPGQVYFSNMLVIFGLGTLGISFFAIAVLASDRDRVLATAAGVIGWFGAFCGAAANVLIGFDLAAAATVHVSSSAAAQILVSANTASAAWVFFIGYFAGIPVAVILTGIALWRSQAIPRWLPVLFVVALIAGALAPPGIVSVPLSLPFVIVMMLLARRIWSAASER